MKKILSTAVVAAVSLFAAACEKGNQVESEAGSEEAAMRAPNCQGVSSNLCDLSLGNELRSNGQLVTTYRFGNGRTIDCTITSGVDTSLGIKNTFKESAQHPKDVAVAYLAKNEGSRGEYYMLRPALRQHLPTSAGCSSQKDRLVLLKSGSRIVKHTVAQDRNMVVTNAALLANGEFIAFRDSGPAISSTKLPSQIDDFQLNTCFEVPNRSFKNSIAFGITSAGQLINFKEDGTWKLQSGTWASITAFKEKNNVCAAQ